MPSLFDTPKLEMPISITTSVRRLICAAVAFATIASTTIAQASILPKPLPGWRTERIDFPLTFAPDLDYRGFEELHFGPGMFEPDAPSYWSYAFAIEIEGEHDADAEFWKAFLRSYYRGLCVQVAAGRNQEVDPESIRVAIQSRDDHVMLATVDLVDAFVTGKPIQLRLELSSHPHPRKTELFAIGSPAAADTAVWKDLISIREEWRKARPTPIYLNHLFFAPDVETYAALAESEFLRDAFGVFEQRRTVRADQTYEGLYWYGSHTYFEFLAPSATSTGHSTGSSGIAFGIERTGGTDTLSAALGEAKIRTFAGLRTRELDGEQIPWFDIMGVEAAHTESKLSLFTIEYDPLFLTRWHPSLPPTPGGISRHAVLERYAHQLEQTGTPLFDDVKEVFLELDKREADRFDAMCRVMGYSATRGPDSNVFSGPHLSVTVRSSDQPGGITGFRLSLRREVEPRVIEFGRAKLDMAGRVATFSLK